MHLLSNEVRHSFKQILRQLNMNWSDIGFRVRIKFSTVQKASTKPVPCLNRGYTERSRLISRSSALAILLFLSWPQCFKKNSPACQIVVAFVMQKTPPKTIPENLVIILSLACSQGCILIYHYIVSSFVNADLRNKKQFCLSGCSCLLSANLGWTTPVHFSLSLPPFFRGEKVAICMRDIFERVLAFFYLNQTVVNPLKIFRIAFACISLSDRIWARIFNFS